MAEDFFNAQQTFSAITGRKVVSVKANGGSVVLECRHGTSPVVWITMKTYTVDTVEVLDFMDGRVYRFTPAGGATYAL